MYPELFSIGPITIYSYGVLLAISYLLGLWLAMRRAKAWGLDSSRILDLGIYIIIAALVGAKLLLLVVDFDQFSGSWADLLSLARSGGVFYGGLILAVLVGFWYVGRHGLPSPRGRGPFRGSRARSPGRSSVSRAPAGAATAR